MPILYSFNKYLDLLYNMYGAWCWRVTLQIWRDSVLSGPHIHVDRTSMARELDCWVVRGDKRGTEAGILSVSPH